MKYGGWHHFVIVLMLAFIGPGMICGCDTGEQVVDEVTGNRAVRQYDKSKKDIEKVVDQQAKRYDSIPDDDKKEDDK